MKIRPVEAQLFHAHGRTAMTKPTDAFRNFANVPKDQYTNCSILPPGKGGSSEDFLGRRVP
jgi:hypothetical protein